MEIETTYIAKDGSRFDDPLECEKYEKQLGTLKGSIGNLINELRKKDPRLFLSGFVVVGGGNNFVMERFTVCCDDAMESFVNISDLTEEQRYLTSTVGGLIESLQEHDKDLPCQYMILTSPHRNFSGKISAIANYNEKAWK